MKPYRYLGGSTVVLAAACIISLFAAACGSERGEGASHGSAPKTTDVAHDSGGKAPPAPSIGCALFPDDVLALLREIKADDFEAVDVSSLIVDPDTGQVRK